MRDRLDLDGDGGTRRASSVVVAVLANTAAYLTCFFACYERVTVVVNNTQYNVT